MLITWTKHFFSLLAILYCSILVAQIKVNTTNVCLGDVASFSYQPTGSSNIISYKWAFGDGFTSQLANPKHLYKKIGPFTVQLEAKTNTNQTINASIKLNVRKLPVAGLGSIGLLKACLNTDAICMKDQSVPASSSQPISSKIIIWGDGAFEKSNANEFCHTYTLSDLYTISYEVTDIYGCKGFDTAKVEVVPSVQAKIKYSVNYTSCSTARICISNKSLPTIGSAVNYQWIIDGKKVPKSLVLTPYCIDVNSSKTVKVTLLANNSAGCSDTTEVEIPVSFETNRDLSLSKKRICYGDLDGILASYPLINGEKGNWYLNNQFYTTSTNPVFTPKRDTSIKKGMNYLKLVVVRGNCEMEFFDSFEVVGPRAKIQLFNHLQCNTNKKVFFVGEEQLKFVPHLQYEWTLTDAFGEKCIAERAKGLNKYRNCNESTDWWHKHIYDVPANGYKVELKVTDTVTGCSDYDRDFVNLMACGQCTPAVNCLPVTICQNEWLFSPHAGANDPYLVTLDSGKTWKKYPIYIDESYEGKYNLGFIYQFKFPGWAKDFGDDSIQISGPVTVYDTILCSQNLTVKPIIKDSFDLKIINNCKPLSFSLDMANGSFEANDSIFIWLGDSLLETVTSFSKFTIDSLSYNLDTTGIKSQITIIYRRNGCQSSYSKLLEAGYIVSFNQIGNPCTNEQLCFIADVIEVSSSEKWSLDNNLGSIEWELDNEPLVENDFTICKQIKPFGPHQLLFYLTNSKGCKDTIQHDFIIQEIKADVTQQSKSFYCNKLRQFFDSSALMYPLKDDRIIEYKWDWGTKNYSTLKKDPFKSFVGIYDSIEVSHVVVSKSGCKDTITYTLNILTSKPKFRLKDSLGCAPFTAQFINESENCSQYIWEYGDHDNNTYFTYKKDNPSFTYKEPGTYFINLIGIDTIYNPYTGSLYYCQNKYPFPGQKIKVTVLPSFKTGIDAPDTVCLGAPIVFESFSDSGFLNDVWDFGDGTNSKIVPTGSSINYSYYKTGLYHIKLNPYVYVSPGQPYCHQKAVKDIFVLGVDANFLIDPASVDPIFHFSNLSVPITSNFNWNFGDPASGTENFSTEKDPSHNYDNRSGSFEVCLVAQIPFGCKDTFCLELENNYKSHLKTYNTFTPGDQDGYNDEYDIDIEGESYYELTIFNRYGTKVYQSKIDGIPGDGSNWNGQINNKGALCAQGTYYYTFTYAFANEPNKKMTIEGVITLIR